MSILIKYKEMPTSCRACPLKMNCDDCEGWECVCVPLREQIGYLDDLLTDKRRDDCPLVEIPPHGRLIDADALGNSLERLAADKWNQKAAPVNWSYAFEECLEMVDNAPTIIEQNFIKEPTIIPAEEGER